jgi:hypothetical protein
VPLVVCYQPVTFRTVEWTTTKPSPRDV